MSIFTQGIKVNFYMCCIIHVHLRLMHAFRAKFVQRLYMGQRHT